MAVMAADLQEPVSLVRDFFAGWPRASYDVAVGARSRAQTTAPADVLLARSSGGSTAGSSSRRSRAGGVDVFGCTRQVAERAAAHGRVAHEPRRAPLLGGLPPAEVPYDRLPRPEGKSAWSFRRKVRYLLDSIFSFTDLPITLIIALGVVGVVVSTVWPLAVLVAWATARSTCRATRR